MGYLCLFERILHSGLIKRNTQLSLPATHNRKAAAKVRQVSGTAKLFWAKNNFTCSDYIEVIPTFTSTLLFPALTVYVPTLTISNTALHALSQLLQSFFIISLYIPRHAVIIHIILRCRIKASHIVMHQVGHQNPYSD